METPKMARTLTMTDRSSETATRRTLTPLAFGFFSDGAFFFTAPTAASGSRPAFCARISFSLKASLSCARAVVVGGRGGEDVSEGRTRAPHARAPATDSTPRKQHAVKTHLLHLLIALGRKVLLLRVRVLHVRHQLRVALGRRALLEEADEGLLQQLLALLLLGRQRRGRLLGRLLDLNVRVRVDLRGVGVRGQRVRLRLGRRGRARVGRVVLRAREGEESKEREREEE